MTAAAGSVNSSAIRSTVATRSTAVMPLSVAKAAIPITAKTTTDFRLPPPIRTSVLLPQPDDRTMPKPNMPPPMSAESQMKRLEAYSVLAGSIRPAAAMPKKPIMATPIAMPHMRMRVQSPMLTTSLTAPMVQKWVRCAMAPKTIDRIKPAQRTWEVSALSVVEPDISIPQF